jgi:O-acetylserine/cysteine efflux transporter
MHKKDFFFGLLTVIIWGLNFIAIQVGLTTVPPLLLGALRFLVVTFPLIFFFPRPPIPWKYLIALGLTINTGQFAFLFLGMKLGMPSGLASLIIQSQVFFTSLLAIFILSEKSFLHHVIGLLTASLGILVIGLQHGGNMTLSGFIFTICAAISWAIGNIITRKSSIDSPSYSALSLVIWSGAVAILPLLLLSWFIEGPAAWEIAWQISDAKTLAALIYLGYFASLIGYVIWSRLLTKYPAGIVSPLALLVPVVGISSSALLLHEQLSFYQGVGILLVMLGLIIHVLGKKCITRILVLIKA